MRKLTALAILCALPAVSSAQEVGSEDSTFENGILVTSADVTTCPYRFVQPVNISVTTDWGGNGRPKIFEKLRQQALKVGADAVVLVKKGGSHMSAWAFTRREYSGRAIRYVDRKCAPVR